MSSAEWCFGVRPCGTFKVYDSHGHFYVTNRGNKLIRLTVEVLEPWHDSIAAAETAIPGVYFPSHRTPTE